MCKRCNVFVGAPVTDFNVWLRSIKTCLLRFSYILQLRSRKFYFIFFPSSCSWLFMPFCKLQNCKCSHTGKGNGWNRKVVVSQPNIQRPNRTLFSPNMCPFHSRQQHHQLKGCEIRQESELDCKQTLHFTHSRENNTSKSSRIEAEGREVYYDQ
jgi:hypothetical protein